MTRNFRTHTDEIIPAIQSLEDYFMERRRFYNPSRFPAHLFHPPGCSQEGNSPFPKQGKIQPGTLPKLGQRPQHRLEGRGRKGKGDHSRRQLQGPDGLGEVHGAKAGPPVRLRSPAYLGKHPQPRCLHRRLEYLLHALLGRDADRRPAPSSRNFRRQFAKRHGSSIFQTIQRARSLILFGTLDNKDTRINLNDVLEGNPLLILSREAPKTVTKSTGRGQQEAVLPITLDPPDSDDFLSAILRTKEAWIEVSYENGRREVRHWRATQMKPTSNVIGNLRSRPEFRNDAWQKSGIAGVRVSIEHPDNPRR